MSSARTNGRNGHPTPESISRSSSFTVVSPAVRDGVGEIVTRLVGVDDSILGIEDELRADVAAIPDMRKNLFRGISKLGEEVNKIKLDQAGQIEAIRNDVKENTKHQILQLLGDDIQSMIVDTVAAQVKKEMEDWCTRPKIKNFVGQLINMVDEDSVIIGQAHIQLENSLARHANSTFDIHDDLNTKLKAIKRHDGRMSEFFPPSLGGLFLYDPEQLIELIKDYGLHPLDKHSENLNRFLIFIGVNVTVPDQLISFSDEQPPAYGNATGTEDQRHREFARRGSSASQDAGRGKKSWF